MKKLFTAVAMLVAMTAMADTHAKPWSFWYWMYGAVTKPAIKADLEGMQRVGLGGTYLMPIRGVDERPEYEGRAGQLTPEFWDMVDYSMTVADSLGLKLGVHICDGFALAGGPWFTPAESMQKVVWSDTIVTINPTKTKARKGSRKAAAAPTEDAKLQLLPGLVNEGYYEDIAAFAVPVGYASTIISPVSMTTSPEITSDAKNIVRANEPCSFTYDFGTDVDVRAITVSPSGTNIQCQRLKLECSNDGENFVGVMNMTPPRQGWQNTAMGVTFSVPATMLADGTVKRYRYYRFSWSPEGTEPGSEDLDAAKWKPTLRLKAMTFHADPLINHWEGKTAGVWRVAPESTEKDIPTALCVQKDAIIPLRIERDGTIATPLPAGTWRVMRFGHTTTGQTNATAGGGKGLECDKFSAAAVNKLVDNWFGKFAEMPSARNVLKYLHVDSWECGCQNWSSNFAQEFLKRRGYDIIPYLPVMAGIPVGSAAETERVLRDVRTTVNDLINDNFFAVVRDRAHAMGMEFSSESIAPTMVSDGLDHYRYADIPMGEYWLNSPTHDKPNDMLDAISGAHIYGKNIIQAEGFTEVRGVWDETPAMVKPLLDRNFALGMNKLFFHVNAHNPWMDRKPGMTLDGIGLFFQRDQTWYDESKPFVGYITRCQQLLQQGRPVQDIAVFIGEEMPRRAVLPERLVSILPGIFGEERVESEHQRLANVGQPMAESPVGVNHSAGIVDTRDWVNCLNGYQYDSFNPDVLLNLATAKDHKMVLQGGAEYPIVVLPGKRPMDPSFAGYSPEVTSKIEALRKAGVIIIDETYDERDFSALGVEPDLKISARDIAYTHRRSDDGEIYFLSNQNDKEVVFSVSVRQTAQPKPGIICAARPNPATPEAIEKWRKMMNRSGEDTWLYFPAEDVLKRVEAVKDGPRTKLDVALPAGGSAFLLIPAGDDVDVFFAERETKPSHCPEAVADGTTLVAEIADFTLTPVEMSLPAHGVHIDKGGATDIQWNGVEEMKYFSGHAVYEAVVKIKKPQGAEMMVFDNVRDIAHVWVNGIDCGIAWTAPYSVNIGHALKNGKNSIRIEVVNTWANALRGLDEGKAPYEGIWTNARYRMKSPYLLPAGIIAPVRIVR